MSYGRFLVLTHGRLRITRGSCSCQQFTRIPALPFCIATLKADRRADGFPNQIKHLGDHIRRRRLELGLLQKDMAEQIVTHTQTVTNWETDRTHPALPWLRGILQFLGHDPRPIPDDIGARLRHHRLGIGRSQAELAGELGVDPGTLSRWERGE